MKKSCDSHSPNLQNPNNVNLWVKKGVNVEDQRVTLLGENGVTMEDKKEDQKEDKKANNNAKDNGEDVVADVVASSIFKKKLSL